ncbi:alpha-glucan family phosphorylase [Marinobacter lipolyticus]|uniref:alpha-glucan family phosphorylase n=1 Tax=Marinobacter lipolyticus TaxID=209639 RepID=UPI001BCFE712|nr:alpha-glucan family phosphorylase [Marinobacter lipolyticus]MBS8239160.1 alpha-glucan family phosphorylase [Marinobacter lipolyticus]
MPASAGLYLHRRLPEELRGLAGLALDLRWTWHHGSDVLWRTIDEECWDATHNAWLVLNSVSGNDLTRLAADPDFIALLTEQLAAYDQFCNAATWFGEAYPDTLTNSVAYFCMEYGMAECLPLYSGGLGVLAGDTLKASSDLGVPLIAVGLLYQQGYFRQEIDADGEQLEFYPYNDPTMLPLMPLRDDQEEWVRVAVELPGRSVRLRVWSALIGRCRLLLLDSNDPRNEPKDRGITSELYSGDPEKRLQQELVLGLGGWRLLQRMGMQPSVVHINEGHCAFVLLERLLALSAATGISFEAARLATRAGNLFTTHTSVASGFDRFPVKLLSLYLADYLKAASVDWGTFLQLGQPEGEHTDHFNMSYLAVRLSSRMNAVSRIHRDVSRHIFSGLFPRWPLNDIPVEYVTNGVHTPSWDSPDADALWTEACGKDRWRGTLDDTSIPFSAISDERLWQMRRTQRRRLIHFLRKRLHGQHCEHGNGTNVEAACGLLLDSEALTLGFARRFTDYKRPDLLLKDEQRLIRLLTDRDRPLQIVLAGKAHPKDIAGKAIIRRWKQFIRHADLQGRVVFINDYDLGLAAELVQGVDVWLNTPRHPWEACGTSGMKVLVNGGLNLSQFDGWWAEAWRPEVGWAIRQDATLAHLSSTPEYDGEDALELYELLERAVIPLYYDCDHGGLPRKWLAMIRASMETLTPLYSANRMMREYTERFYIPMEKRQQERAPAVAQTLALQQQSIREHWPLLRFGPMECEEQGAGLEVRVQVYLDGLEPSLLRLELVAERSESDDRVVIQMQCEGALAESPRTFIFRCRAPLRAPEDYTPRLVLGDQRMNLPIEEPRILWRS